MKLKHNKKRNVAFLFECLIQELTKSIVKQDSKTKSAIIDIIKEHFKKESSLRKELDLYRSLYETSGIDPYAAEKIILETKKEYERIDKDQLFEEQTKLINKINKTLSKDVYHNFISNYKNIATIHQIFNSSLPVKTRVLLEHNLVYTISSGKSKGKEMKPIDNLTYKTFIEKFNDRYSGDLMNEQKELLSKYIISFSDNGLSLKMFMNEEIIRLKNIIEKSSSTLKEERTLGKIKKVLEILEEIRDTRIDPELLQQFLKIQKLAGELSNGLDD